MFHMQEGQVSLSLLFKNPAHNAVSCFSCFNKIILTVISPHNQVLWILVLSALLRCF